MKKIAFDSDALIYTEIPNHPHGLKVLKLLQDQRFNGRRIGSTLLLPEMLIKPTRLQKQRELGILMASLSHLKLISPDQDISMLAVRLGARYALKTPDAIHLATAVHVGADAFVTNNRKGFNGKNIAELTVVYPDTLSGLYL